MYKVLSLGIILLFSIIIILTAKVSAYDEPVKLNVDYRQFTSETQTQLKCLADNLFFESGFEPVEGQIAVAMVTLNRVLFSEFENTICGVVKEKTPRGVCQFSWYCDPNMNARSKYLFYNPTKEYENSLAIAIYVYTNYGMIDDPSMGALYYHADYVNPRWSFVVKTRQIGRHIFYQQKDQHNDDKTKLRFS